MHRFFVESLAEPTCEITDAEAHHLIHVLRLRSGSEVELLDGKGCVAEAVVSSVARSSATVTIRSRQQQPPPRQRTLTVAASPPKTDRLKWMVEKLTELGVDRYVPLQTERTVVSPRETKLERLQSTIVSACKQSGRAWLLEVAEPQTVAEVLQAAGDARVFIAHPGTQNVIASATQSDSVLLIGPEGGFTDSELDTTRAAGAIMISWPGTILRTETAAIAFATRLLDLTATAG